jgi:hypothetical protein
MLQSVLAYAVPRVPARAEILIMIPGFILAIIIGAVLIARFEIEPE